MSQIGGDETEAIIVSTVIWGVAYLLAPDKLRMVARISIFPTSLAHWNLLFPMSSLVVPLRQPALKERPDDLGHN